MLKVIGGVPDGEYKAIASGTLPSGKPVVVNSDGTVSVVQSSDISAGTPVAVTDTAGNKNAAAYDAASQKVVLAWYDAGNSDKGTAVVGTVSGETITFGSETVFEQGDTDDLYMIYEPNAQKVVIAYKDVSNSSYGTAIVGTVSGTSISFGTAVVFESGQSSEFSMSFDTAQNKVLIIYKDVPNNQYGTGVVGTVSGTSISFGTPVVFESSITQQTTVSYDSNSGKHLVAYGETTSPNQGKIRLATISGTSVSYTAFTVLTNDNRPSWITSQPIGTGKVLVAFCYKGDSDSGQLACVSIDGSTMTVSDLVEFDEGDIVHIHSAAITDTNEMVIVYSDEDADNSHFGKFIVATVDGTTPTFSGPVTFESAYTERPAVAYDSNTKRAVVSYQDQGNSSFVTACVLNPSTANLTAENYIGVSQGYTDRGSQSVGSESVFESASVIDLSAAYDANAQKVVVAYTDNGNSRYGTAVVGTVSGTSITFGTPVVFVSRNIENATPVYDSNAQKIVIGYQDRVNAEYGTGIVGTVSGSSISFGTAQVFDNVGITELSGAFDSNNNKVVFAFNTSSFNGKAVVGTVSGTSISFGSFYTFESGTTQSTSTVYDTNAQKIVISYVDGEDSFRGKSVVATVSGTTISYGSLTTFNNASTGFVGSVYDPDSQKVIVTYADNGNSSHGTAIVGTVSGTSISFGSEIVFNAASTQYTSATYDEGQNKLVVAYRDVGNSNSGTVIPGTVSGSSITFGDETVFNGSESNFVTAVYDAASGNSVISYIDNGNSNYGTSVVFQNAYDNSGSVADGDNATVDIIGSLSTNQGGLTAGQQYYVQTDGTVGTTPADPSVLAGTAVSATKMVVKS